MLVTGIERIGTYKKTGDSLAGRFFKLRLNSFLLILKKSTHIYNQKALKLNSTNYYRLEDARSLFKMKQSASVIACKSLILISF